MAQPQSDLYAQNSATYVDPEILEQWHIWIGELQRSVGWWQDFLGFGFVDPVTGMALSGTGPFHSPTDWFGWDAVTPDPFPNLATANIEPASLALRDQTGLPAATGAHWAIGSNVDKNRPPLFGVAG